MTTQPIPFRLDLAGGWLDQPFVSRVHPGAVVALALEPDHPFEAGSGMGGQTRAAAIDLWDGALPAGDPGKLATILFRYANPPGKLTIAGSHDAIGITHPGLTRAHYHGGYWPERIDHVTDGAVLDFLEEAIALIPLGPRGDGFDPLADRAVTRETVTALAQAADAAWDALLARDRAGFGAAVRASFEAQVAMFPYMVSDAMAGTIARWRERAIGWKVSGAGGGGYLIVVSDRPIDGAIRIRARRG